MDQPSIDGINSWLVSKAASELGLKVAVSGLGGDELFRGYSTYRDIPRWVGNLAIPSRTPGLGRLARQVISRSWNLVGVHPKAAGMIELGGAYPGAYFLKRGLFMPWEVGELVDRETLREELSRLDPIRLIGSELAPEPRTPFAKVATLESAVYMRNQLLRDTDWASMAHGLEVRVPLVDHVLLKRLAPILVHQDITKGKTTFARAPRLALPQEVVSRAKTGFSTPIAGWLERLPNPSGARLTSSSGPWARRWAHHLGTRLFGSGVASIAR